MSWEGDEQMFHTPWTVSQQRKDHDRTIVDRRENAKALFCRAFIEDLCLPTLCISRLSDWWVSGLRATRLAISREHSPLTTAS